MSKYHCPTCTKGFLKVKKDSFHYQETNDSEKDHEHPGWDPDWIQYVYSCLFECTNSACKDTISSSGNGYVEQRMFYDEESNPDTDFSDYFRPESFTPHLKMFVLPKETPDPVIEEISKSFNLIFSDPPSSASHIRIALEHLLTHLKIKRFTVNKGKKRFLFLHGRIDLLPKRYGHIKDIFLAVKWLGNAGSHGSHEVSLDDVLDSYELMNELLIEIFSKNRSRAKSLARKINRKRGPK
jgi:hypothetical protein